MGAPLTEGMAENNDGLTATTGGKKPAADNDSACCSNNNNTARPSTPLQTYISLIQQYLAVFLTDNAVWLAERCVAEYPTSSEAIYLLALCHYRSGKPKAARQCLEKTARTASTAAMDYLAAICSYDLKDYNRAEEALLKTSRSLYKQNRNNTTTESSNTTPAASMDEWILSTTPCPIPNGAAGLALLGKICRQSNRKGRAVQYFRMSLQLDPFLWSSFEALSELGAEVEPAQVFGVQSGANNGTSAGGTASSSSNINASTVLGASTTALQPSSKTPLQPMETPCAPAASHQSSSLTALRPNMATGPRPNRLVRFETPGLTPIPVNSSLLPAETPVAPTNNPSVHNNNISHTTKADHPAVLRRAAQVASRQYYPPSPETPLTTVTRKMRYLRGIGGDEQEQRGETAAGLQQQGGGRNLFLSSSENQASNQSTAGASSSLRPTSQEETEPEKPLSEKTNKEPPPTKVHEILQLLCTAGTAYQHLCQYRCKEALRTFSTMPVRHQMTGWALHQQGRAHLELNDFAPAQRCLEQMQSRDPSRTRGLELLSTVYWHLKKEVDLSHLAQRVVDWDRMAPEAWCVVGNCFSLQKDHETALVFFGRSLQLDPEFTYTHTLSGYEYMANEDFEKAITCFRQALRTDDRHYNAWYGLGAIYHRQEKFDLAEYHFQRAVSIHPTSSVLRCNLGISQYANGKAYVALDTLSEAFRLDPQNPQARFQRATIYTALHRPAEALEELKKVRDAAPREATVHFALGKVWKRLGRPDFAMKCFLTAMDLDPKDNQMIKSAMDKLDEPDVDEEAMAAF